MHEYIITRNRCPLRAATAGFPIPAPPLKSSHRKYDSSKEPACSGQDARLGSP